MSRIYCAGPYTEATQVDDETARTRLYEISESDATFEAKAAQLLELGVAYLGVETGHLTRIDQQSSYWRAIVSTDPPDGQFPVGLTVSLEQTYCRRAIETQGSLSLHSAESAGYASDPAYITHGVECYHGTPLRIDDQPFGTVCFVSVSGRDEPFSPAETLFAELITRVIEADLQQARTDVKIQRLDEFASVISHDLRNPLNVVQGRLDLERATNESTHLQIAANALDRMETLISDVLTVAREGRDVAESDLETVHLAMLGADCWDAVSTTDATFELHEDLTIRADSQRLQRLLENCIRNAIEHVGPDVHITVGALPDRDGFYIADDGPGIPEADRERIFDSGFSTGSGGAGLGLSIVSGVAEAHGWDVTVTDADGGGARFEVRDVIVVEEAAFDVGTPVSR